MPPNYALHIKAPGTNECVAGEEDGHAFIAMEYVEGLTLARACRVAVSELAVGD
jgi:hypothetical protein